MSNENVKTITQIAQKAKEISITLASLSTEVKNQILLRISENIQKEKGAILEANKKDIAIAEEEVRAGKLSQPLLKRLILNDEKVNQLSVNLKEVASLPDPVGVKQWAMRMAPGLELYRVSCPLGVVATIFESRPEVVVQISALCIKSGNAVILKGGRESAHTNRELFRVIAETIRQPYGLDGAVNLLETREEVNAMFELDRYIDLIIPRGSNEFVRYIQENSRIPVLGHSSGICHVFADAGCDLTKSIDIILDSKTDYPAACNSLETLLIHEEVASKLLPALLDRLQKAGVKVKGCSQTVNLASQLGVSVETATEVDWEAEYLDLILAIRIVPGIEAAIDHINKYGSHHTDSILTENMANRDLFFSRVDSACVFHNASTRFSDGFRFGLGAEIGISTNKTHARGPVGLEGMVIYKYLLMGNGQIVGSFSGPNAQKYLHELIVPQP